MDKYSVGRAELLSWINDTLELSLNKIEQVCVPSSHEYDALSFYGPVYRSMTFGSLQYILR